MSTTALLLSLLASLKVFQRIRAARAEAAAHDVAALLSAAAFDPTTQLSWNEQGGLVHTSRPGYWWTARPGLGRRSA